MTFGAFHFVHFATIGHGRIIHDYSSSEDGCWSRGTRSARFFGFNAATFPKFSIGDHNESLQANKVIGIFCEIRSGSFTQYCDFFVLFLEIFLFALTSNVLYQYATVEECQSRMP